MCELILGLWIPFPGQMDDYYAWFITAQAKRTEWRQIKLTRRSERLHGNAFVTIFAMCCWCFLLSDLNTKLGLEESQP